VEDGDGGEGVGLLLEEEWGGGGGGGGGGGQEGGRGACSGGRGGGGGGGREGGRGRGELDEVEGEGGTEEHAEVVEEAGVKIVLGVGGEEGGEFSMGPGWLVLGGGKREGMREVGVCVSVLDM